MQLIIPNNNERLYSYAMQRTIDEDIGNFIMNPLYGELVIISDKLIYKSPITTRTNLIKIDEQFLEMLNKKTSIVFNRDYQQIYKWKNKTLSPITNNKILNLIGDRRISGVHREIDINSIRIERQMMFGSSRTKELIIGRICLAIDTEENKPFSIETIKFLEKKDALSLI